MDKGVTVKLGPIELTEHRRCAVIAEVGLSHEGSLGTAHALIEAIADAGADAVKFQTHIAEAESTDRERFRVAVFPQDKTRTDYWRRTSFTKEQWRQLKDHADGRGLLFLSSPFSLAAVDLLQELGVEAWKVSSGDINNAPLLHRICSTGKPILVSTGMSPWVEIDAAVDTLRERDATFVLLQCSNLYPCPPESLGLNVIGEFRSRYGVPVGFSDHSAMVCSGISAFALGAVVVEVHVTLSKKAFGPDVRASLDLDELCLLASSIRFLETAFASPVDKDRSASNMDATRELFMKGIVASRDIEAGTVLMPDDLAYKKPLEGLPAAEYQKVVGLRLTRGKRKDEPIRWKDITHA
jgi:N,N'-diacetyllegionaminate synthase